MRLSSSSISLDRSLPSLLAVSQPPSYSSSQLFSRMFSDVPKCGRAQCSRASRPWAPGPVQVTCVCPVNSAPSGVLCSTAAGSCGVRHESQPVPAVGASQCQSCHMLRELHVCTCLGDALLRPRLLCLVFGCHGLRWQTL